MKQLSTSLLVALLVVGCHSVPDPQTHHPDASDSAHRSEASLDGANATSSDIDGPLVDRRVSDTGRQMRLGPPPHGYIRITGEPMPDWSRERSLERARSTTNWLPLGPRPITGEFWSGDDDASGRVVSIAPHPSDPDTLYIASASGGIWKTTDAGQLWTPMSDELSTLNHGCVAIDPQNPDTVYAGTGEYTTGSSGDGLFRSTDGGASWDQVATTAETGSRCSKVIVDPTDADIIHWTGNLGYARSIDGGATWSTLFNGLASDLALVPSDPQTLYLGAHSDGIYQSIDGGDTWTRMAGGLPASGGNRMLVSVAPSAPGTVYAALLQGSSLLGFYKTTDSGATWVEKTNTPNFPSPQGSYDCFIDVDPSDANVIYGGGVFPTYAVAGVIRSADGGDSWNDITIGTESGQLHPDMHTSAFDASGRLWVGNDGGVWHTEDEGLNWINTNATLTVTQNYTLALHPTDPTQLMAGTQDNGTVARDLSTEDWPQIVSGDGGFLVYDFDNPTTRYTTYVRLSVFRLDGAAFTDITGPWAGDPANFIAPLEMDPNDSKTLVGGTNRVWRTQNAATAATWTAISPSFGGRLNALAVATGASDTLYVGSTLGEVHVTTDASNWDDRTAGLPSGQISDILVDPANPGRAYVTYYNTTDGRLFRTLDFGVTWTDLTGSLPSGAAARALAVDWSTTPNALYVGSGAGVYASADDGANWEKDGADLPNVNIGDLMIDAERHKLYAGTYGRGVWFADLALFVDGFESGDTTAWSETTP